MVITVVGIPFAAWKYVGWLFLQQQILFEDKTVREVFRVEAEAAAEPAKKRWRERLPRRTATAEA